MGEMEALEEEEEEPQPETETREAQTEEVEEEPMAEEDKAPQPGHSGKHQGPCMPEVEAEVEVATALVAQEVPEVEVLEAGETVMVLMPQPILEGV